MMQPNNKSQVEIQSRLCFSSYRWICKFNFKWNRKLGEKNNVYLHILTGIKNKYRLRFQNTSIFKIQVRKIKYTQAQVHVRSTKPFLEMAW